MWMKAVVWLAHQTFNLKMNKKVQKTNRNIIFVGPHLRIQQFRLGLSCLVIPMDVTIRWSHWLLTDFYSKINQLLHFNMFVLFQSQFHKSGKKLHYLPLFIFVSRLHFYLFRWSNLLYDHSCSVHVEECVSFNQCTFINSPDWDLQWQCNQIT